MRRPVFLALIAPALAAFGCHEEQPESQRVGLVDPGEYAAATHDDSIRLQGEDKAPKNPLSGPVYMAPVTAVSEGVDYVFVEPTVQLYKYFTGDTPGQAAREIVDARSADNRRHGILRLADDQYAREGKSELELYAEKAQSDKDYTVRAAGIRALNRSRDKKHTQVFIEALKDDQPLVRMEAVKALANVPDPQAAPALIERLQRDPSRDVRVAAADALRCYKTGEVAHALIAVLNDPDFSVAWQARQSLILMTARDFRYDEREWGNYLLNNQKPFA